MSQKTAAGLVEFCQEALAAGTGYVYGTLGQICTENLLDDRARAYPANNLAGGKMRKVGEKWLGRRVVDCSGLIKYYLMAKKFGENPRYTAELDAAVHINNATKWGEISTLPEVPGTLLWMPGHVGVYIGGGQVIEARGTEYGVVQTPLKERGWKKWFWIHEIDYDPQPQPLALDTHAYTFETQGQSYTFLAKYPPAGSAGVEKPSVSSSCPDSVSVKFVRKDSRGYLYEITAHKPGLAVITVQSGGQTAILRASLGCQLDTHNHRLNVGQKYQFLSRSVKKPDIDPGDVKVLDVRSAGMDQRGFLFEITAKQPGKATITATLGNWKDSLNMEVAA